MCWMVLLTYLLVPVVSKKLVDEAPDELRNEEEGAEREYDERRDRDLDLDEDGL